MIITGVDRLPLHLFLDDMQQDKFKMQKKLNEYPTSLLFL